MSAYLYFALDLASQRIKIGCTRGSFFSTCPVTRVRALGEKVQFLGCIPLSEGSDDLQLKRELQSRFENAHEEGDWFQLSQALRDFIRGNTQGHVCSRCAGETMEKKTALNKAANEAVAKALSSIS